MNVRTFIWDGGRRNLPSFLPFPFNENLATLKTSFIVTLSPYMYDGDTVLHTMLGLENHPTWNFY